jgi:hypothetical protein
LNADGLAALWTARVGPRCPIAIGVEATLGVDLGAL